MFVRGHFKKFSVSPRKINIANLFWHTTIIQGLITLSTKSDLSAVFIYADDTIWILIGWGLSLKMDQKKSELLSNTFM